MKALQWFIFFVFLGTVFLCLYLWHLARKQLTPEQKKLDVEMTTKQDLICLSILLIGYLFLVFYPNQRMLIGYLIGSLILGILMEIHNYHRLKKSNFPKTYFKWAILYSAILWVSTLTLGMFLLLRF